MKFIEKKLQDTINKLCVWADTNGMVFSEEKTKFVLFTRTFKVYLPPSVAMNEKLIERVSSHNFLGLHFDERLSWTSHLSSLLNSCNL